MLLDMLLYRVRVLSSVPFLLLLMLSLAPLKDIFSPVENGGGRRSVWVTGRKGASLKALPQARPSALTARPLQSAQAPSLQPPLLLSLLFIPRDPA